MKYSSKGKITHTVKLTGKDILEMMPELGTRYTPGRNASIEFQVPQGDAYSGSSIEFSDEELVTVTWTTEPNEL